MVSSCMGLTVVEKKSIKEYKKEPIVVANNFIWGINGHPLTNVDYTVGSIESQLALLKEHQLEYYRIDITTDEDGIINTYPDKFDELIEKANQLQIRILPIIKIDNHLDKFNISAEEAYDLGKRQMAGFIKNYGKHFEYYELGNEQENKIINANSNGMYMTDYDAVKFKVLLSYLKGMTESLKRIQPEANTMISAGWLHWGYFDLLQSAGLDFDIISYHWYSNMGSMFKSRYENVNIIDTLNAKYNKPIWITEINKKDGSIHHTEEAQALWVDYFMHELDHQSNVKAFFIYELYDEPNLKHQSWAGEGEANYGIVQWERTPKQYNLIRYKPVSEVLKYRIEETKYGYENFINSVLTHLDLSVEQVEYGVDLSKRAYNIKSKELIVDQLMAKSDVLKPDFISERTLESADYIRKVYEQLLNRNPSENEIKYWNKALKNKKANIFKAIFLSEEYWENAIWAGYEARTRGEMRS